MKRGWTLLSVGTGAGVMYLLDPDRGRRRRALLRDKAVRLTHEARRALGLASRDLVNRSRGIVAEVRYQIADDTTDDDVLTERVRAKIGHVVSHPHVIRVTAKDGQVTLTGPILAEEIDALIAAIESVPGVHSLSSSLESHEGPDIPSLQGETRPHREGFRASPATRLLASMCGVAFATFGARRGGVTGGVLRGLGLTLLAGELYGLATGQELVVDLGSRAAAPSRRRG